MSINTDKDIREVLIRDLEKLGVGETAGRVYIALLPLPEAGISLLERETGLHRQIIYNTLSVLENLGLVKHALVRGRRRFSAHPPRQIQALIDEQRRTADRLVEALTLLRPTKEQQEFEVYQGVDAYRRHQMETLLEAEEGGTVCIIAGVWKKFYEIMGRRGIEEYEKLRVNRKIAIRYLGLETDLPTLREAKGRRPLFAYRVITGLNNGLVDTSIWQKSIALNFFGDPIMAFLLKNENVAKSQLAFFESLWKLGKE